MTSASGVLRKQKKRCQRAAPAARIRMALGCVGNQMEMGPAKAAPHHKRREHIL
jgi:hypothetical protein